MTDQDNPTRDAQPAIDSGADVIRAVNGWCFERSMYVVAIGRVAYHDRYHCRVQPAYGADVLCVESDTLSGLLERLNRWHTTGKPDG
jgi:hypothetical protein